MTSPSPSNKPSHSSYIATLDVLRLFAIILVSLQHGFSVIHRDDLTFFKGLSLGQYGVSIFCVLSGFLALRDHRSASQWIMRRLTTLLPAYWIVMIVSFLLTWMSGYKSFDFYQFCSQMLGMGFFTHGWNIVNIVSWFISLILLCYALVFLAKLSPAPGAVMMFFVVLAMACVGFHINISLSRHVLSFNCAAIAGYLMRSSSPIIISYFVIALFLLSLLSLQYSYAAVALLLLMLCIFFPNWSIKGLQRLSKYIYEYFLVHGMCFVGAVKIMRGAPVLSIILGVILSAFAAWLLKSLVDVLNKRLNMIR